MITIKIQKIELSDGHYMVRFFSPANLKSQAMIDLSRTGNKGSMTPLNALQNHNNGASGNHTQESVNGYIKRVMGDIGDALLAEGEIAKEDVEKLKGLPIPFIVPGSGLSQN